MGSGRVHYIDWLRVLAVLLLFPFHAGRVFNAGELFYAKSAIGSVPIGYVLGFIDRWHMPLLFMLAGASTYFAMKRRSVGKYAGERAGRLLVPLLFGIFVIVPPQTWLGSRTNDAYTGSFVDYLASLRFLNPDNLFGRGDYYGGVSPAHLWFILFLWMIAMMVLPLLAWGRSARGSAALARAARAIAKPVWWPVVVFAILVGEGLPDFGGKVLFLYLAYFVVGYIAMHDDAFADATVRWRIPALVAGVLITVVTLTFYWAERSYPDPSVPRALFAYVRDAGGWLTIVGLLGFGRVLLDRPSRSLSYLAEASYPVYILHQTVIVALGFYLVTVVPSPAIGWPLLIALAVAVTFALYEVVRRVPPLRFLFGMRARRVAEPAVSPSEAG
jgi:glucans biosynthesis protein C